MPLENCKRGLNEPEHCSNCTKASSFRCNLFCVIHQHSCLVTPMTELMLICLSRLSHGVWMMYGCIELGIMYCAAIGTEHSRMFTYVVILQHGVVSLLRHYSSPLLSWDAVECVQWSFMFCRCCHECQISETSCQDMSHLCFRCLPVCWVVMSRACVTCLPNRQLTGCVNQHASSFLCVSPKWAAAPESHNLCGKTCAYLLKGHHICVCHTLYNVPSLVPSSSSVFL